MFKEFFPIILKTLDSAVLAVDIESDKIHLCSDHFLDLWGIKIESAQALGTRQLLQTLQENMETPINLQKYLQKYQQESLKNVPGLFKLKDGRSIEFNLVPFVLNVTISGWMCICKDVSEEINNKNKLKDQESLLTSASQMSSMVAMAQSITHEINNPLSIIRASTNYLKKLASRDNFNKEEFNDIILEIDATVDRLAKTMGELRNITHGRNFDKSECSFNEILEDVLSVVKEKFDSRGIVIKKTGPEEVQSFTFRTKKIKLVQIFTNLLNNSYDALCTLDIPKKWIEIDVRRMGDKLIFSVTDAGLGIPREVRTNMFNPLYTTKKMGISTGMGIGLSISKTLAEGLGGRLFYSDESQNTKFTFEVPLT